VDYASQAIPQQFCIIKSRAIFPSTDQTITNGICETGEDLIQILHHLRLPFLYLFEFGFKVWLDANSDCDDYLVLKVCSTDLGVYQHKSIGAFGRFIDVNE
jgi:hypothetical protein